MSRVYYTECRIEVEAGEEREAFECDDAEVWIEGRSILISYFDDEGIVVLEGQSDDEAGWTLAARSRPRRAFLTPMSDSSAGSRSLHGSGSSPGSVSPACFAGEIDEHGETAVWRLRLGAPGTD